MKKHLVFIINPASGTDRVKALETAIAARLDQDCYSYEVCKTERPKHGTEIAAEAARAGAWAVVAVGGDGSVNDVPAGVYGTPTHLAIIPKGSGNGLARSLGIPLPADAALEALNRSSVRRIDVGFANEHIFLSNAGTGFDALIARKFAGSKHRGLPVYSWLVTKYLWLYRSKNYMIEAGDGHFTERAFMIASANGTEFGYNFRLAADADITDGLLDLVIVKPFPKLFGAGLALRMLRGTLTKSSYVKRLQVDKITVSHPGLETIQTDGDTHTCDGSLCFRVERQALGVLVPDPERI